MKSLLLSSTFKLGDLFNQPINPNITLTNMGENVNKPFIKIIKLTPEQNKKLFQSISSIDKKTDTNQLMSWLLSDQQPKRQSKIQLSPIPPILIGSNNKNNNTPSVLKSSPSAQLQKLTNQITKTQQAWKQLQHTLRQNSKLYDNTLTYLGVPRQKNALKKPQIKRNILSQE